MSENNKEIKENKKGLPPGVGMAIGVTIGIIIGLVYGVLIMGQAMKQVGVGSIFGISMGIAAGIAIGAILDQSSRKPMPARKLLRVVVWLIIVLFIVEILSVYLISLFNN